jgi:hypothetical protein
MSLQVQQRSGFGFRQTRAKTDGERQAHLPLSPMLDDSA